MITINKLTLISSFFLVLLVGVAFGQLKQAFIDHIAIRDYQIAQWSQGSAEREQKASLFKGDCLSSGPVPAGEIPVEFISIEECSKNNGTYEIFQMLNDNVILGEETISWPLSIIL
jgi:hypothetical protein